MDFEDVMTQEELSALRREFHRHPESGFSEFWTTAFIASRLAAADLDVRTGGEVLDRAAMMGVPSPEVQSRRLAAALAQGADPAWIARMDGLTGLCADVRPDLPAHTVLRFDIDCVDVEESTAPEHAPAREGFLSLNPGECHACGHDGHAAIGVAAALWLQRHRDGLRHNVRILFQPAEEGTRGAEAMVAAGVLRGAKYFFGAHIGGRATQDHMFVGGTHGFLATTKFDVEFRGRAAHAGSDPQDGLNSVLAAAACVLNMHALPRHGRGETRINVGRIEGGTGRNVIPDHARLVCETRGSTAEADRFMYEGAVRVVEGAAAMYGQESRVTLMGRTVTAASDEAVAAAACREALAIPYFHGDLVATMGRGFATDDACTFMEAMHAQGGLASYALLGSRLAAGHHSGGFDFNEALLRPSVQLFCRVAMALDAMASPV